VGALPGSPEIAKRWHALLDEGPAAGEADEFRRDLTRQQYAAELERLNREIQLRERELRLREAEERRARAEAELREAMAPR